MKLNILKRYKHAVCCVILLSLKSTLVAAQGPIPQFWQMNNSPTTLTWDLTPWNGQVDNGTGSFTAATFNWNGNGGNYKIGACKNIAFGGNPGIGAAGTVTLPGTVSVSSIAFHPAQSGDFTLTGGTITSCRTNLVVSVDNALNPAITSSFTGSCSIEKKGLGTLALTGAVASTNTNKFIVSEGTLKLQANTGSNITLPGSFTNNSDVYFSGVIGAATRYGVAFISTTAGSKIDGTGTWTIDSPTAPTDIWTNRLGLCYVNSTGGSATVINYGNFWIHYNGNSTLSVNLNGPNTTLNVFGNNGDVIGIGTLTGTGTVQFPDKGPGGSLTLSIGNDNGSGVFSGIISNYYVSVSYGPTTLALRKAGTGTQTLSGTNTYTGTTTVNGGTLIANNTSALGTGAVTINNGGTVTLNANILNNITVNAGGTLNRNGHSTGTVTGAGTVNP